MRSSWRLWMRVGLIVVVLVLVWIKFVPHHHTTVYAPVRDLAVTSPLNQPGTTAAPADAYEVYSALYQAPMNEPLVFAEDSITDIPQVNGSCLKPSTPQEREMSDAFVAANQQSHRWEQKFSIPQGYKLLSRTEIPQVFDCIRARGHGAANCSDYKQLKYVRYLGVPGFDRTHTHALVSVIKSCGGSCGSGGIFAVEKTGSTWRRSPTTDFTRDCSWMY